MVDLCSLLVIASRGFFSGKNMFERYSEAARLTIFRARYVASQVGSEEIDTEHLLMGVLTDIPSGQPGRILLPRRQKRGVSSRQSSDRTNSNSGENSMARRRFLSQLLGLPFLALGTKAQESKKTLRILMRSSWGTDDPTRASFVFAHALALADAGHEVQVFLTADANYLMRKATLDAVIPIGWPPLSESREKVVAKHIPVFA
jgi:hypothetical protein